MQTLLIMALMIGNLTGLPKIRDRFVAMTYREQTLSETVAVTVEQGKLVVIATVDSTDWGVGGDIEWNPGGGLGATLVHHNNATNAGTTWTLTWDNYSQITGTSGETTTLRLTLTKPGQTLVYEFPLKVIEGGFPGGPGGRGSTPPKK